MPYCIYIIAYNPPAYNRQGLIRMTNDSIEILIKPSSFDLYFTLGKSGSNIVATFLDTVSQNSLILKKLI